MKFLPVIAPFAAAAAVLASIAAIPSKPVATEDSPSTPRTVRQTSNIQTEENLLDNSKKHTLLISSATTTPNSIGSEKVATLVVRCDAKSFDTYIHTPTYNGISFRELPTVSYRWDKGPLKRQSWDTSKGGDSFFHPNPAAFLPRLVAANTYTFGWKPYDKTETAVRFDLANHKADLKKMQELCS